MTLEYEVKITPFNATTLVKPEAPTWMIINRNTNGAPILIDNQLFLAPGGKFGVDAGKILSSVIEGAKKRGAAIDEIKVVNKTQFTVSFPVNNNFYERKFLLVETFYKFLP